MQKSRIAGKRGKREEPKICQLRVEYRTGIVVMFIK
jgi:hypothetical protein